MFCLFSWTSALRVEGCELRCTLVSQNLKSEILNLTNVLRLETLNRKALKKAKSPDPKNLKPLSPSKSRINTVCALPRNINSLNPA